MAMAPWSKVERTNERVRLKGEQLVLFTTRKGAKASDLQSWGRSNGITELAIPRDIREVDALPVLGTGKLDYVTMGGLAAA